MTTLIDHLRPRSAWAVTLCLPCLCLLIAAVGCSSEPPAGSISGTVTLDGEPLTEGQVTFISSAGDAATGSIGAGGAYTLNSSLPPGQYTVTVAPPAMTEAPSEMVEAPQSPIPDAYHTESTSGLTENVVEGENSLSIELTSGGPGGGNPAEQAP